MYKKTAQKEIEKKINITFIKLQALSSFIRPWPAHLGCGFWKDFIHHLKYIISMIYYTFYVIISILIAVITIEIYESFRYIIIIIN